tara:strand:- start:1678 stop:2220 length:543 start_codon:yes stop_codon:yes gene_type:complete
MAKRGYRGKHPHNDMKVSKHSESTSKRSIKLDEEYNKLNQKQKYSYIRDHQGFFPQATLTISGTRDLAAASQITMSTVDGTLLSMKGVDGATNVGNKTFKANGTDANATDGIVSIVNANLAGRVTATNSSNQVLLTADKPGPDGNTAKISATLLIPDTVSINGIATNASSSAGFGFFTGG